MIIGAWGRLRTRSADSIVDPVVIVVVIPRTVPHVVGQMLRAVQDERRGAQIPVVVARTHLQNLESKLKE